MTFRTCLSSRGQVTVALMLGVYLVMTSRSHFNQMLNHNGDNGDNGGGGGDNSTYATMNMVYQVAYAAVQVPAFLYADRVDPVPVLGAVPLGLAVSSAMAPYALIAGPSSSTAARAATGALYAVNGALLGVWWPFMSVMLANWSPPAELAHKYATINTGVPGGTALGNAFAGLFYGLHNSVFRHSFFVVSIVCVSWSFTWLCTFYSHPSKDPGVSQEELDYLKATIQPKVKAPIPWRKMATSMPVWALLVANYGSTTFYTVLIMYMPKYLKGIMKVNITENGFMSTLPSLGQMFVIYVAGHCASSLQTREWMNVTNIRKMFTFFGMIVPACMLLIAPVFNNNYIFYGILVVAYAISGSVFSGFRVSQIEMAPNFTAAITAVGDLIGSLAINSINVAFILVFDQTEKQTTWNQICWVLPAILFVFAGPYILLGSSKIQPWNKVDTTANEQPTLV